MAGAKPWSWRSYVDRSCALVKRDPSRVNLLLLFVTITYMFSKKNSTLMFVGEVLLMDIQTNFFEREHISKILCAPKFFMINFELH